MCIKKKIMSIVALLIVVAVFIGVAAMHSMTRVRDGMEDSSRITENVSRLKDLKSEMQSVLIGVREIVLSPEPGGAPGEKENLDKRVAFIDSSMANLTVGLESAGLWNSLQAEWNKHKGIVDRIYASSLAGDKDGAFNILMTECNPTRVEESRLIAEVVVNEEAMAQQDVLAASESYNRAWWILLGTCLVGVVLGALLAAIVVSKLNRTLETSITSLREHAEDVNRIAAQLASGSADLAEGATQQASALEETSSALEEMASVTRQNADNAAETTNTTKDTLDLINTGARTVESVNGAMSDIEQSSEKIGEIIKAIEDIAFQTNLLALNAAVEAARAGEAGKGFAVVADEVRNLAIRSSNASKSTAELIQGTVDKVRKGSLQVRELASNFERIESESQNVGRLVGNISSATDEQAQGVDQVNIAVAQMDKVTQSNAASAEESAAAANELKTQSSELGDIVASLASFVYGGARREPGVIRAKIARVSEGVTRSIDRRVKALGMTPRVSDDTPRLPGPI